MLAIERGELDGIVGYSWGVARVGNRDDLAFGLLKILMPLGLTKHKELPAVPLLDEFVTDAADRQVLELTFSRQAIGPAAGCTARPRSARGRGATCGIRRSYARPGKATEVHMKILRPAAIRTTAITSLLLILASGYSGFAQTPAPPFCATADDVAIVAHSRVYACGRLCPGCWRRHSA